MEIRLLGTAAAEGIPAHFSSSRVSQYAREHRGKDIRTRSGALVDGCIKIDFPPDTLMQLHRDGLDARDWSALIFTHGDDDHFSPLELQYFLWPFSEQEYFPFPIYANAFISHSLAVSYPDWPIEVHPIESFVPFQVGDYTITPLRANHNDKEECLNHIIEKGGTKLLYATDTGVWSPATWNELKRHKLDALVIECTDGFTDSGYEGHLNVPKVIENVRRLRELSVLSANSVVVTTHHSHNGNAIHSELEEALNPHGIQVGYDGMVVSF